MPLQSFFDISGAGPLDHMCHVNAGRIGSDGVGGVLPFLPLFGSGRVLAVLPFLPLWIGRWRWGLASLAYLNWIRQWRWSARRDNGNTDDCGGGSRNDCGGRCTTLCYYTLLCTTLCYYTLPCTSCATALYPLLLCTTLCYYTPAPLYATMHLCYTMCVQVPMHSQP